MTIVIDTTPLRSGHKTRGIGRYTRQLAIALQELKTKHQIVLTSKIESISSPDLVHYPFFDLFHSHLPLLPQAPIEIVTIHDLIPLRFRETFRPGLRSGFNLWLQMQLIKRVAAIITDSEFSKNDINEFLHIDKKNIFVVPLGVDQAFRLVSNKRVEQVKKKYHLPEQYILYVGDVNVNKNVQSLIQAIAGLPISLVLVGASLSKTHLAEVHLVEKAIQKYHVEKKVITISTVPFDPIDDLVGIYNGASVYVQPSLYEGFGLPILEAMACGVPVVSSNKTSLPEVVGEAGLLVDPTVLGLRSGIQKTLKNKEFQRDLQKRGFRRVTQLSWEKTAKKTLQVYEQYLEKR